MHVRFGDGWAVRGAWLRVASGSFVALVGESGAGKSTLLRTFNGMTTPAAGRVAVDGLDVRRTDLLQLRRRTAYIAQDGGLLPHWSVERNVALPSRLLGQDQPDDRAAMALDLVGLDAAAVRLRLPHQLSGGQRQRVALARALAAEQPLLLLDEPFAALDRMNREALQQLIATVRQTRPLTMLLVTHDLVEAARLATRIAVMRRGVVEQCDTLDALLDAPASEYVEQLFAPLRGRKVIG